MTRNSILYLEDDGQRLVFNIRQMPALQMESWLTRVAGVLPPEQVRPIVGSPTALAALVLKRGLLALVCGGEKAAPLLKELLDFCSMKDSATGLEIPCTEQLIDERISHPLTLLRLRWAALLTNLSFALDGARKRLVLPKETAFRRAAAEQIQARAVNLPQVCAALIGQGMASLNDLRTGYTYPDALDLLEVLNVRNYNQWAMAEEVKRRRR